MTILVVWAYSTFVSPGKAIADYEQFAQSAGPWISVIAGPPITFFFVRMATKKALQGDKMRTAIWIMAIYLLFDIAVLAGSKPELEIWLFATVSALGRCLGAWLAVRAPKSIE